MSAPCRATLSRRLTSLNGWPHVEVVRCGQRVGTQVAYDRAGEAWAFCGRTAPGGIRHEDLVLAEMDRADAIRRAWSDAAPGEWSEAWGR